MKKVILAVFTAILAVFLFSFWVNNNPAFVIARVLKGNSLDPENLTFQVNFLGAIPVGQAVIRTQENWEYLGKKVILLTGRVRNLDIFSVFFKGSASVASYVDARSFSPLLFRQELLISGQEPSLKEAAYDQKNGVMTVSGVQRQIPADTQDPLSAVFNLTRMDFDKVKDFEFNINTNNKNYILRGTAQQKEKYIRGQSCRMVIVKAQISRRDKNPYHKSQITMVLLKGQRNIPVLIKVFASGFFISTRLLS